MFADLIQPELVKFLFDLPIIFFVIKILIFEKSNHFKDYLCLIFNHQLVVEDFWFFNHYDLIKTQAIDILITFNWISFINLKDLSSKY